MLNQRNNIAPHIDEIEKVLGGKVDRKIIEEKLLEYTEKFLIDLPSAKKAIVKNYGGDTDQLGMPRTLMSLTENEPSINLKVKILAINPKTISFDESERIIHYGLMGDPTGVLPFTLWGDTELQKGDAVLIKNAYVKDKFRGRLQINLGNRVSIERVPAESIGEIPSSENFESVKAEIGDLQGGMGNLVVKGKILDIRERSVEVDGQPRTVFSGILGDKTGSVQFSAWDKFEYEVGDILEIENAYTKTWNDRVQLGFNNSTEIKKMVGEDADDIAPSHFKVEDLKDGMEYVNIKVRIIEVNSREVNVQGGTKIMFSGICGDDTGTCSFTAWKDFELEKDDVVEIKGSYVKQWRGPQLTLGDNTTVTKLDRKELPDTEEICRENLRTIEELIESEGGMNIKVEGVILDIQKGSGLIWRCPICRRILHKDSCTIHKKVEGEPDLRIKAILDDGTGAVQLIAGRNITENMLETNLEQAIELTKENMRNPDFLADKLFDLLVAKPITVRGNVTCDEYGIMMIARSLDFTDFSPEREAADFLEELGV